MRVYAFAIPCPSSGLADGRPWCEILAMARSKTGNNAFTGVFLVGLGIIACFDFWWPGIMFVIAAAIFVSALLDGQLADHILGLVVLLGIGTLGLMGKHHLNVGFPIWPILFIAIGLGYLVKTFWKRKV